MTDCKVSETSSRICDHGTNGRTERHSVKIAVYGICKNERTFVERCLHSARDADVIVFCDTGSTDGTWELLQNFDHPNKVVTQISVSPWRFDDARNVALMLCPPDVDLCISLDADEELAVGWREKLEAAVDRDVIQRGRIPDRYNHRFITIWDWQGPGQAISDHWHERIHTRHGYLWKLPVHEVLKKLNGEEMIGWIPDLTIIQKPDTSKPRSSYLPLLEQSVKEDPKIWKSWSFLAGEYANAKRYGEAIQAMNNALTLPEVDKAYLSYQLGMICKDAGDPDAGLFHIMNASKFAPHVREYVVYLASFYNSLGRPSDAYAALLRAEQITERTFGYDYNPACWGQPFEELKNHTRTACGTT